ncbi:lysine transporter LysE [Shouchella clausii]|nr:lysine transporter LysE [Shouchella clausii]
MKAMGIAFLHGMILSIGLILPLGPQNLFIFNQGATHKKLLNAMPTVITASLCDTALILLAVMGVSAAVLAIPGLQVFLLVCGFIFLLWIGQSIWRAKPEHASAVEETLSMKKQVLFALSVSVLNPHAVLDTIGVIGTSSLRYESLSEKAMFALACIAVSWLAFFLLAAGGKTVRAIDKRGTWLVLVNKISAICIWAMALLIGAQLVQIIF